MALTIQEIKNFAKSHPIEIVLTFGSLSAGLIYYFTSLSKKNSTQIKSNKKNKNPSSHKRNGSKNITQEQQITKQLNRLKQTRQKMVSKSKNFNVDYIVQQKFANVLTQDCVLNIFDQCIQLVDQQELNNIYNLSRKARRSVFQKILINTQLRQNNRRDSLQSVRSNQHRHYTTDISNLNTPRNNNAITNIKQKLQTNRPLTYPEALAFSQMYYRFVCTFEQEFKYLIQKTQKDFAAFLDIDFNLITQSIDYHISKQNNQEFKQRIQQWTSSIRQNLKNKLVKYNQPINPQLIKQILSFQIQYLKQKRSKLLQTIHKLGISNEQQLDALPTLLATILEDTVYFKFNIEQQQMTVDLMHLSKNKQLEVLVQQFQRLTQQIVQQMFQQVNKDQILNESDYY